MTKARELIAVVLLLAALGTGEIAHAAPDVLPAWNSGAVKTAILSYVTTVTDPESDDYVAASDRVAVFDNDGTLWAEQPMFFQFEFVLHRIRQLAPKHPEWRSQQPFQAVLEDDREALLEQGLRAFRPLAVAAQTGMTLEQYDDLASAFLQTAKHPELGTRYIDLVYAPIVELVAYLQRAGFKVFIVSGGDIGFIRSFSEQAYGIPRENVIGSSVEYELKETAAGLAVFREGGTRAPNVRRFKAQNIQLHIGRRPILAVGNSDGDLAMLQYTSDGNEPTLVLLIDHDDADREFSYNEGAERVLAMALGQGWHTVSVRRDFSFVFPIQSTN
jgi:phosphoserine phosphatase